ncbi:PREDICTED: nodal modulator 1-like [Colobus angolensis palliatus]|uniref:nodal modulator 1-like n=1 Tax=Colobus angolensis palliatus TaxID=336983 RepID=UPI0005F3A55E|nr:PREDICTED: nodal modulator 1-like [Colobus angolensis palliatus]
MPPWGFCIKVPGEERAPGTWTETFGMPVFHVMGFSVTGRVLNGPEGDGVPEAVVTLNNQIKVKTKADGSFRLENITTGTYTIHAQKEHLYFETVTIKIAPNTPQLADIIATGFDSFSLKLLYE